MVWGFPEFKVEEKRTRIMFHLVSEFWVKMMELIFFFFSFKVTVTVKTKFWYVNLGQDDKTEVSLRCPIDLWRCPTQTPFNNIFKKPKLLDTYFPSLLWISNQKYHSSQRGQWFVILLNSSERFMVDTLRSSFSLWKWKSPVCLLGALRWRSWTLHQAHSQRSSETANT